MNRAQTTTVMECPLCNHNWTAEHYKITKKLECPTCGYYVDVNDHGERPNLQC